MSRSPRCQTLFRALVRFPRSVTYQTFGTLDSKPFRLSLGAEEESAAKRRIAKIEHAVIEGVTSPLWAELADSLPPTTFKFFANHVGYSGQSRKATAKLTWQDLCDAYEIEMQRKVDNKERGATRNEGIMSVSTRARYRITVRDFTAFLEDKNTPLVDITPATIAKYKVVRHKAVVAKKQSRGGAGVALDIAILHGVFAFAMAQKMLADKPISMARESKPGKNPKNGARAFNRRGTRCYQASNRLQKFTQRNDRRYTDILAPALGWLACFRRRATTVETHPLRSWE